MGSDIHTYIETRSADGHWEHVSKGLTSDYYKEGDEYFGTDKYKDGASVLDGRNYKLFSFLADVRNGYGVAGCDTGNRIVPIKDPSGVPHNASLYVLEKADRWGGGGHSHSSLTLKELIDGKPGDYDTIVVRGVMSAEKYLDFVNTGDPYPYSGGVAGPSVVHITNDECKNIAALPKGKSYYTKVEWTERLIGRISVLYDHVVPQLKKLSKDGKGEDVRMVFWFDN